MNADAGAAPVAQVSELSVHFRRSGFRPGDTTPAVLRAVDGVSFNVAAGQTVGLVGESGSGKSTVARAILGLQKPTTGSVRVFGVDVAHMRGAQQRTVRRQMQAVFQDPYASLNAFKTVHDIIAQPLQVHHLLPSRARPARVAELLSMVGLDPQFADRYPRDFSGGQRQRIAIARALASEPQFVVLDEPLSSLDVSIQAQIVNLLLDLRETLGLTYLFIAHDLSVVRLISDEVVVMYAGRVMERAPADDLFANPLHPYTLALIGAIPLPDPETRRVAAPIAERASGSQQAATTGCPFRTRCAFAKAACAEDPDLVEGKPRHFVSCHFWTEVREKSVGTI